MMIQSGRSQSAVGSAANMVVLSISSHACSPAQLSLCARRVLKSFYINVANRNAQFELEGASASPPCPISREVRSPCASRARSRAAMP
jgi:hypothetical protein